MRGKDKNGFRRVPPQRTTLTRSRKDRNICSEVTRQVDAASREGAPRLAVESLENKGNAFVVQSPALEDAT